MIQAASDIFLGATRMNSGRQFYIPTLEPQLAAHESAKENARGFARLCGRTLARAQRTTGDSRPITGYSARAGTRRCDRSFAMAYADPDHPRHAALGRQSTRPKTLQDGQSRRNYQAGGPSICLISVAPPLVCSR